MPEGIILRNLQHGVPAPYGSIPLRPCSEGFFKLYQDSAMNSVSDLNLGITMMKDTACDVVRVMMGRDGPELVLRRATLALTDLLSPLLTRSSRAR